MSKLILEKHFEDNPIGVTRRYLDLPKELATEYTLAFLQFNAHALLDIKDRISKLSKIEKLMINIIPTDMNKD